MDNIYCALRIPRLTPPRSGPSLLTTARGGMAVLTTGLNPTILIVTIMAKIKNDIVMCTIGKVS